MVPLRFVLALSNVAAVQKPLSHGKHGKIWRFCALSILRPTRFRAPATLNGAVDWDPELSQLALLRCGRLGFRQGYERPQPRNGGDDLLQQRPYTSLELPKWKQTETSPTLHF
jgi:hypothetical protein